MRIKCSVVEHSDENTNWQILRIKTYWSYNTGYTIAILQYSIGLVIYYIFMNS